MSQKTMRAGGFTIVECLVALAIVCMAFTGVTSAMSLLANGTSKTVQDELIKNTMSQVVSAFGDADAYCGFILKTHSLSNPDVATIDFHSPSGSPLSPNVNVIKKGFPIGSKGAIKTATIALNPVAWLDATTVVASLDVSFSLNKPGSTTLAVRSLPIYVTVKGGQVETCSTSFQSLLNMSNRICQIENAGYSTWVPTPGSPANGPAGDCQDTGQVKWINGSTHFTASCTGLYEPIANRPNTFYSSHSDQCKVSNAGNITPPTRTYSDGYVSSFSYPLYDAHFDSMLQACSFDYAMGTLTASTTNQIKCVPK